MLKNLATDESPQERSPLHYTHTQKRESSNSGHVVLTSYNMNQSEVSALWYRRVRSRIKPIHSLVIVPTAQSKAPRILLYHIPLTATYSKRLRISACVRNRVEFALVYQIACIVQNLDTMIPNSARAFIEPRQPACRFDDVCKTRCLFSQRVNLLIFRLGDGWIRTMKER